MNLLLQGIASGALRYLLRSGGNALALGLPVGDICLEAWEHLRFKKLSDQQLRDEVQFIAQSNDATRRAIPEVVKDVAGNQSPDLQIVLETYLTQVPGAVRRSLRSPLDPTGRTIPSGLVLRKAGDLRRFIPDRLPRFKPGDRPVHGNDLVLEELLGTGGFGEVWKARHEDRPDYPPVALKFCLDVSAMQSLRNEMRLLDRVSSQVRQEPGIVHLLNANLRAEPPYLEYEYIDGGDLGGLVLEYHQAGAANWETMARLFCRLARIVGVAHRHEIVHRDLKPDNILTQRTPAGVELKVADFGIGGIAAGQEIQLWEKTRSGSDADGLEFAFTPIYAPPQQRNAQPASPRDDVYALGVIWYQALTGDLLREPPTGGGWKKRFVEEGMPAPLVELLEQCIDADASVRPADATILAERLSVLLIPTAIPAPGTAAVPAVPTQPGTASGTKLRIDLVGVGGERGNDTVEVYFDGQLLGTGCAATGFHFQVDTRPGEHHVELRGRRKKKILFFERQAQDAGKVFLLELPEPGEYRVEFRFTKAAQRFKNFRGNTIPNVMELKHAGGPVLDRQATFAAGVLPVTIILSIVGLLMIGGLVALILVLSLPGHGYVSMSFDPSEARLPVGQSVTVKLRAQRQPYHGDRVGEFDVELRGPKSLLKFPEEVHFEEGQEETSFRITAGTQVSRFTIEAVPVGRVRNNYSYTRLVVDVLPDPVRK
jgi:hypothetical protein